MEAEAGGSGDPAEGWPGGGADAPCRQEVAAGRGRGEEDGGVSRGLCHGRAHFPGSPTARSAASELSPALQDGVCLPRGEKGAGRFSGWWDWPRQAPEAGGGVVTTRSPVRTALVKAKVALSWESSQSVGVLGSPGRAARCAAGASFPAARPGTAV